MFSRIATQRFSRFSRPSTRPLAAGARSHSEAWLKSASGILAILVLAITTGNAIATEKWVYVLIAVAAIVAVQWPIEAALSLYAFLVPFEAVSALGSGNAGVTLNWAVGALAGMGLLVAGIAKQRLSMPSRTVLLWLAFLFWGILTMAWAVEPGAAKQILPTAVALVFLYALAASWTVTKKQLLLLCGFAVAGGFLAAIAIVYLYRSGVTYGTWTQTARASLIVANRETNPNGIAAELLLPISLAVSWFISARRRSAMVAAFVMFAIMSYAAFLTMSRAFVVAFAVMFCVFIWRLRLNRRLVTLAAAILALAVSLPSLFFVRLQEALATRGAGRLDIWQAGLAVLKAYWLPGAGLNNFPVVYQAYAGYAKEFSGFNRGSHNMYLNVTVELGIVGLVLMSAAMFSEFRAVTKLRSALGGALPLVTLALEAACWAVLANAFFGDILWSKPFWVSWLLLAMAVRLGRESAGARQPVSVPEADSREFSTRYQPWRAI